MQTIRLVVKDGYLESVLDILGNVEDNMIEKIEVQRDNNHETDPYFYERKDELHRLRNDIRSGKIEMFDFDESMDELITELQK